MTKKRGSQAKQARPSQVPCPTRPGAPLPQYNLAAGLFEFYSTQATAMLAQYRNINELLGPTNDWTAPGTLCEVMIRGLIRRVLPTRYSVDKGFIFGRRMNGNEEVHSPEVDVLVHDTHEFTPVYRLDDFVIVHPAAVRGVIQVKRTLGGDKLKKAIGNLVDAKQHLKAFQKIYIPNSDKFIFSAAIFFGDGLTQADGGISTTYESTIRQVLQEVEPLARPHFLGSLENRFYVVPFDLNNRYEGYRSQACGGTIALIYFLAYLTQSILPSYACLTFHQPEAVSKDQTIQLDGQPA